MPESHFPLVAVDVGNSRLKLGLFDAARPGDLPAPIRTLTLSPRWTDEELLDWLPAAPGAFCWWVSSVQRTLNTRLLDWFTAHTDPESTRPPKQIVAADLPLKISLAHPDRVGMDRLVAAVAVNRLRDPARPAIAVDLGTAITVDLVSERGAFVGGAILPGIGMAARALHQFTDLLPLVEMSELAEPPEALGRSTMDAMRSGLYWGAVGAMRELIARLSEGLADPQVFLTGGAAPAVASLLCTRQGASSGGAQFVPHLTLVGIALAAESPDERLS